MCWNKITKMFFHYLLFLLSLVVAFFFVADRHVVMQDNLFGTQDKNYLKPFAAPDILLWIAFAVGIYLLIMILSFVYRCKGHYLVTPGKVLQKPKPLFLIVFFAFLVAWMPYVLSFFPGAVYADGFNSIWQGMSGTYNNHHPILFTLWVKACVMVGQAFWGSLTAGIVVYTITQTLIMAAVMAYFIVWMRQHGVHGLYCLVAAVFIAFFPLFPFYAIALWKDTYFSLAVFLFVLYHIDVVWSRLANICTGRGLFRYFVQAFFVCFLRNNGIYLVAFSFLVLLLLYRKAGLHVLKNYIVSTLIFLVAVYVVQGPVFSSLIQPTEKVESLGIPNQQIFAVFASEDGVYDEEDAAFISQIWDVEEMKEKYTPCLADTPKWYMDRFDEEYLDAHIGEYLAFWLRLGLKNPKIYIRAWLMETLCFWSPRYDGYAAYIQFGVWENDYGIEQNDLFDAVFGWSFYEKTYPHHPISAGLFFWIGMLSAAVASCSVPKQNRLKAVLPVMPMLALWLTIMIATPIASSLRYAYSFVLFTPLTVAYPALMQVICIRNQDIKVKI